MIFLHRALGGVQPPLADGKVGLEAVFGGAVAGEVLDGQDDGALLQAVLTVLVAPDQLPGNSGGDLGTLAVGAGVTGPAGVGGYVHLRTVHDVQAAGAHHLPVGFGHLVDHVEIAIAHAGGTHAQEVGVADVDGIGVQGVGNGHAALAGLIFHILGAQVVIQGSHTGLGPHLAPVNAGGELLLQHLAVVHPVVKTRQNALGDGLTGIVALENLAGHDIAVFVLGPLTGHGHGGVPQGVQHQTGLLLQGQMSHHVLGTGLVVQPPVLIGGQNTVVVHVLEEQAVLHDDAAGGDADGGAVLVAEQNRLQIEVVDVFALLQDVGGGDVAVLHGGVKGDGIFLHVHSPLHCLTFFIKNEANIQSNFTGCTTHCQGVRR